MNSSTSEETEMKSKFRNLAGRHPSTAKLFRGGPGILAALVLTLTLLGVNPSQAVQADDGIQYNLGIEMNVTAANFIVCLNDSTEIDVMVGLRFRTHRNDQIFLMPVTGVDIDASSQNPSIGVISPDRQALSLNSQGRRQAAFKFTAGGNPGRVVINFTGVVSRFSDGVRNMRITNGPVTLGYPVEIEVRKCTYKISVILLESVPALITGNGYAQVAEMNLDSDGHYRGSAGMPITEQILGYPGVCPRPAPKVFTAQMTYHGVLNGDRMDLEVLIDHAFGLADTVGAETGCLKYADNSTGNNTAAWLSLPLTGGAKRFSTPEADFIIILDRVGDEPAP
jgi:hypothetical protein